MFSLWVVLVLSDGGALVSAGEDGVTITERSMSMKRSKIPLTLCLVLLLLAGFAASAGALISGGGVKHAFTEDFFIEDCTFSPTGSNTYMILEIGHQLTLEGEEDKEDVEVIITVLDETEEVDGVITRVVEEFETIDGELAEISRNFFAICLETGDIFYFGEDVDIYEGGVIVGHEGEWRAGEDDAVAGVMMPGSPMLGARFFQEIAPDVAMDRAEVIRKDAVVETDVGTFERCLEIKETTPIEPNSKDTKVHCPRIGIVIDGPLILTGVSP
jgi:hypothetical protein